MSRHHTSGTCRTTISKLGVKLGKNTILRDINFILNCGELTALIGPNGAGKTTLLKALLGEYPHTGTVTFHTPEGKLRKLRIGYVPQKINTEQNSPVTVYDLFAAFLSSRPVFFGKKQDLARTIAAQLALFDVAQHLDSRLCDLSGGELQRVMLALAVYPVPELLILDEPAAGIDRNGLVVLYRQLAKLKQATSMNDPFVVDSPSFVNPLLINPKDILYTNVIYFTLMPYFDNAKKVYTT